MSITKEGTVERDGKKFVIRCLGGAHLLQQPGVECENPSAPETERVYRKVFQRKRIYLPEELDRARAEVLGGQSIITIGMTGYSSIGAENCAAWGITEGAYEAACSDLLGNAVHQLQAEFPGVRVKIADGASAMGVDLAVINVARQLNLDHLGHSCPKFMFYVEDDDMPVYVAPTQAEYAEAFVQSLNVLMSVGGRMQALEHDMLAAIKYDKRLILLNVLKAISTNGGPPARDATGKIVDATAAFQQSVFNCIPAGEFSNDPYEDMRLHAASVLKAICRKILPPERAYGRWARS